MRYRRLGSSELEVSVLSFGAWQIGDAGYWGADDETDAEAAVSAAIEEGINLFDTAEMYGTGESERVLGRVLGARRGEVYIASKVLPEHCSAAGVRQACEDSLRRLGTDVIDLYQVHWPCREVAFEETYGALKTLQEEGKIREIEVSNFGRADLEAWMGAGGCVSDQLGYNLLFRAIEDEIVPACQAHEVGDSRVYAVVAGDSGGAMGRCGCNAGDAAADPAFRGVALGYEAWGSGVRGADF